MYVTQESALMFTHPPSSQAVVIDSADPAAPARGWG
jgi:hypothetical protein